MSRVLRVLEAGPGVTVQDLGRPGYLSVGLSRGGAVDRLAILEGAALLGQGPLATLEMAGYGGSFEAGEDMRIVLAGAPMDARIDGEALQWNACYLLRAGARLSIRGVRSGSYGYLGLGGGIETPEVLGAKSAHVAAGLGRRVEEGDVLPVGTDPHLERHGLGLAVENRFTGGPVRFVPGPQTEFFAEEEIARFCDTAFRRDPKASRMAVRLNPEGSGFANAAGLSVLSEAIVPGDIQITGDGTPYVLLAECQTTGGYPRIGSVLPSDLPKVAQAPVGAEVRFQFVRLEEALAIETRARAEHDRLAGKVAPRIRDPHEMRDLLGYQLIGGVTAGRDEES